MNGLELETAELAYLLATVDAVGVVGVDDPRLLPSTAKARDATFGKGRKQLEAHGWIQEISGKPGEYDLNAGLVQSVAVIASPKMVVATSRGEAPDDRQLVLHYIVDEYIIELWANLEKDYILAPVPDRQAMTARISEFLGLGAAALEADLKLPESTLKKLESFARKGQTAQAEKLLGTAGLDGEAGKALVASLASSARGQVVVARANAGEIEAGRRAEIFGEQQEAWMAIRPKPDATELELSAAGAEGIGALVGRWVEELALPT